MPASDRQLIASIHDVSPRFEAQVDQLADRLSRLLGGPRFAMLVVPDHWGGAPIAGNRAFRARLRAWHASGIEMFVHGWFHRDEVRHASSLAALKARHMTAGEGEFLGLSREEAARRMADGKALIEDIIGAPVAGFIAPAWLYGPGALAAMADVGFAIAEDHMRVWSPSTGRTLARGPVLTWASRSSYRIASSIFFAGIARHALLAIKTVRIAVHPGDTTVPQLLESIDRSFAALSPNRTIARYTDLLAS